MGRWHVRHQLGTSWCLLRGGCQWKQELWLHGEAWHRQLILWLDCQVFFSTAHACPWYASILMPWHEPGTGGSPQPCRRLRFPGVFLRAEGVIKMSCRRGGRWNEDDLVESSVSDLLRNVTCKPLLFVSFCQVALLYLYINMLKPIAGRISIWIEIIEIDWNFLEQSLRGGSASCWVARRSLKPPRLMSAVTVGLAFWFGTLFITPQFTSLAVAHGSCRMADGPQLTGLGVWNPSKLQQWSIGALIHVPNFWGGDSQVLLPNLRSPNANATRSSSWFENRPPSRERRPQRKKAALVLVLAVGCGGKGMCGLVMF